VAKRKKRRNLNDVGISDLQKLRKDDVQFFKNYKEKQERREQREAKRAMRDAISIAVTPVKRRKG
jgi:hypothetical protein